jgi:hypothetical protein
MAGCAGADRAFSKVKAIDRTSRKGKAEFEPHSDGIRKPSARLFSDSEVTSLNYKEWFRVHWAADIERRIQRRSDASYWTAVGFVEVEVDGVTGSGVRLWRPRSETPE